MWAVTVDAAIGAMFWVLSGSLDVVGDEGHAPARRARLRRRRGPVRAVPRDHLRHGDDLLALQPAPSPVLGLSLLPWLFIRHLVDPVRPQPAFRTARRGEGHTALDLALDTHRRRRHSRYPANCARSAPRSSSRPASPPTPTAPTGRGRRRSTCMSTRSGNRRS